MKRDRIYSASSLSDHREIENMYTALGHAEHPIFGRDEWLEATEYGGTKDNYWGWVGYQLELMHGERFDAVYFEELSARRAKPEMPLPRDRRSTALLSDCVRDDDCTPFTF